MGFFFSDLGSGGGGGGGGGDEEKKSENDQLTDHFQSFFFFNISRKNSKTCKFLLDLILYIPSTIFQLYRDGYSCVEPVLSWDYCVLLKDTTQ